MDENEWKKFFDEEDLSDGEIEEEQNFENEFEIWEA